MKIAHIVCVYPPYAGGIGNVAANLVEYLSLARQEVTVFTPRYRKSDLAYLQSSYQVERLESFIHYGKAAFLPQLFWKLKDFDVIDLHMPFLGTSAIVYLLKKFYGRRLSLVIHYHMDLFGKNWLYRRVFGLQQQFVASEIMAADKVLVSSQDYLSNSRLKDLYVKYPAKFEIMPFGVDVERFFPQPKDTSLSQRYGLEDKKVILFVGALDDAHYFKGVNYLLKAFAALSDQETRLIIVGEGNLRPVYQDLAVESGLADRVIFTGFVPDIQLAKYYNLADVVVLPSIDSSEAFGMVILEAMACGKPVVASDLPGVREILGHNEYGLLTKPKNVVMLTKRIEHLLNNQELVKKISQAGLERIKVKYIWPTITNDLIKVYEKVIS